MSDTELIKGAIERVHKHDTQLHCVNFLSWVRLFADKSREDVDTFTEAFWNLAKEHFGEKAIRRYQRTYP